MLRDPRRGIGFGWPAIELGFAAPRVRDLAFGPLGRMRGKLGETTADEFFDVGEHLAFFSIAERNGRASGAGAARTANAVHVRFGDVGEVVVDHV